MSYMSATVCRVLLANVSARRRVRERVQVPHRLPPHYGPDVLIHRHDGTAMQCVLVFSRCFAPTRLWDHPLWGPNVCRKCRRSLIGWPFFFVLASHLFCPPCCFPCFSLHHILFTFFWRNIHKTVTVPTIDRMRFFRLCLTYVFFPSVLLYGLPPRSLLSS